MNDRYSQDDLFKILRRYEDRLDRLERSITTAQTKGIAGVAAARVIGPFSASPYPGTPGASGQDITIPVAGTYIAIATGTGFKTVAGNGALDVYVNNVFLGSCILYFNAANTHLALESLHVSAALPAGTVKWFVGASGGLSSDSQDAADISLIRIG